MLSKTHYISEKLSDIETKLENSGFVRCHISYLCNLAYVQELRRTELVLQGGQRVPISRNRYSHA